MRYARGPQAPTAFIDRGSRVDVVLDSDEALLAGLRLAVLKTGGRVTVRAEPAVRDRIFALATANGLRQCVHEPDQQEAPQSREVLIEEPTPSTEARLPNVDQIASDAPPVKADQRQTGSSNLQSSPASQSAETTPVPPDEPLPPLGAPAAMPAGKVAGTSSPPRSNVGDERKLDGAAQNLARDHLRKRTERNQAQGSREAEFATDADRRAERR